MLRGPEVDETGWGTASLTPETMIKLSVAFALVAMISNVASQLFFRQTLVGKGISAKTILELLGNVKFLAGGTFSVLCFLFWLAALSKGSIKEVLPYMALLFVVSPLAEWMLFGDPISAKQLVGFTLIVVGVALTA